MPLHVGSRAVTGAYMGPRPVIRAFYKKAGVAEPEVVFGTDAALGPVRNFFDSPLGGYLTRWSWDPVNGAIDYRIEARRVSPGDQRTWAQAHADGLVAGQLVQNGRDGTRDRFGVGDRMGRGEVGSFVFRPGAYDFRIQAVGTRGRRGPWTNALGLVRFFVQPPAVPPPAVGRPTDAPGVARTVTSTTATFHVSLPERAETLQYDVGSTELWSTFSSPLVITGLTPETEYTYRFRARNSAGDSPVTTVVFTTPAADAPVVRPTAAPSLSLTASTTAVVAAIGDVDGATAKELRWQPTGGAWSAWSEVTSPHTIGSLTAGTAYTVEARVKNSAGEGPAASESITTPTTDTAPDKPTAVVSDQTTSGAKITGTAAGATKWRRRTHGEAAWGAEQSSNVFTLTGLSAGTVQRYEISAGNSAGWSDASEPIDVWTVVGQATATHTRTFTSLTITIAELAGAIRYEYRTKDAEDDEAAWSAWTAIASAGRVVTLSSLEIGHRYDVQVRGVGNAGAGAHSEYEWVTRGEPPTGLSVTGRVEDVITARGDAGTSEWRVTQFTVACTVPSDATGWELRYSTEIEPNPELDRRRTVRLTGNGAQSHNVPYQFLSTNFIYYVNVRAVYDADHVGRWSDTVIGALGYVLPREIRFSTGQVERLDFEDLRHGFVTGEDVTTFGDAIESIFRGFNDTVADAGSDFSDAGEDSSLSDTFSSISDVIGTADLRAALTDILSRAATLGAALAAQAAEGGRQGGGGVGTGDPYGGNDDSGGGGRGG